MINVVLFAILIIYPIPLRTKLKLAKFRIMKRERNSRVGISRLTSSRLIRGGINNHIFPQSRNAIIIEQLVVLDTLLNRAMLLSERL